MMGYGKIEDLQKLLFGKKIVKWTEEKLILDDGTEIIIECSENDCCAWADGEFKNVKLDAVITDVFDPELISSTEEGGTTYNTAIVTFLHNRNPICMAECNANNGNGGYYFSVASLVVKNIHYPVVEAY